MIHRPGWAGGQPQATEGRAGDRLHEGTGRPAAEGHTSRSPLFSLVPSRVGYSDLSEEAFFNQCLKTGHIYGTRK